MEDQQLLDSLVTTFKDGINPSNFPLAATLVYTAISKIANKKDITERCEFVLLYIIDNTNSGEHDEQIDTALKQMVPGIVESLTNPRQTVGFFKRCFGCFAPAPQKAPETPKKIKKTKKKTKKIPQTPPQHPRVEKIKLDAI
jgi:hypothetical protein